MSQDVMASAVAVGVPYVALPPAGRRDGGEPAPQTREAKLVDAAVTDRFRRYLR